MNEILCYWYKYGGVHIELLPYTEFTCILLHFAASPGPWTATTSINGDTHRLRQQYHNIHIYIPLTSYIDLI